MIFRRYSCSLVCRVSKLLYDLSQLAVCSAAVDDSRTPVLCCCWVRRGTYACLLLLVVVECQGIALCSLRDNRLQGIRKDIRV